MKETRIECDCQSLDHSLFLFSDRGDPEYKRVYVYFGLNKFNVLRRIWVAIKYIFGRQIPFGIYEEMVLDDRAIKKTIDFLQEHLEA